MLKVKNLEREKCNAIEWTRRNIDNFKLTIGDSVNPDVDVDLSYDYSENHKGEKNIIGIGLGGNLWFLPDFDGGRKAHNLSVKEDLFLFIFNFVFHCFREYSKEDQNNLKTEIMREIETFCMMNNVKGLKNVKSR